VSELTKHLNKKIIPFIKFIHKSTSQQSNVCSVPVVTEPLKSYNEVHHSTQSDLGQIHCFIHISAYVEIPAEVGVTTITQEAGLISTFSSIFQVLISHEQKVSHSSISFYSNLTGIPTITLPNQSKKDESFEDLNTINIEKLAKFLSSLPHQRTTYWSKSTYLQKKLLLNLWSSSKEQFVIFKEISLSLQNLENDCSFTSYWNLNVDQPHVYFPYNSQWLLPISFSTLYPIQKKKFMCSQWLSRFNAELYLQSIFHPQFQIARKRPPQTKEYKNKPKLESKKTSSWYEEEEEEIAYHGLNNEWISEHNAKVTEYENKRPRTSPPISSRSISEMRNLVSNRYDRRNSS